jgi:hypothetical protein
MLRGQIGTPGLAAFMFTAGAADRLAHGLANILTCSCR